MTTSLTAAPRKHRTAKGAQRIEDLTSAAAELFLERGFEAVAVDDLISRVGGSRSNVYTHFGGKEGLFEAAMLKVCAEMAEPLERLHIEELDPERVLPSFGSELVKIALSPRTLAVHRMLTTEGGRFPKVAQTMLQSSYLKSLGLLARWIESQQQKPHARLTDDVPAQALAEQFFSMVTNDIKLRAIVGLVQTPLPEAAIDVIVSRAVRTFLRGASTGSPCGEAP
ncbi:TetR/AcrR family transcriptional regulator [Pseudomonas amygdali]|uniref:TetR/AcrR family transcriptional regulator n=1 Tax=Pseudomonas amygdali TaxID=47877 RepID=UPI001CD8F72D|nr:TetR/AcrR family transcriptional regulator [Pseudomonas amygdali]UBT80458.1 TetR/AcrR family transcriptional regulator [Pseudomonas amygdali]